MTAIATTSQWTLWSDTHPTDPTIPYRWRIAACDILGLPLRPEWLGIKSHIVDSNGWRDAAKMRDAWNMRFNP